MTVINACDLHDPEAHGDSMTPACCWPSPSSSPAATWSTEGA